jgi:ParB-like chromosome segregation protein Spo0J
MNAPVKPTTAKYDDLGHHSVADTFPLMEGSEFDALVEDIKANGLREPITLFEDKILDGRNRYRAIIKAGLQWKLLKEENFWVFDPKVNGNPLDYVVSVNLHRRHLTESQRGAIAASLVTKKLGDNQYTKDGVTNEQAAKMLAVSVATVKNAKEVAQKAAPEINQMVQQGKLRLGMGKKIIKKSKAEQQAEFKRIKAEQETAKAKAKEEAKARAAAKAAAKVSTGATPTEPKANQAMKDLDDFKAKWKGFNEMQRRGFVATFMDELAEIIEHEREQQAMIGGATEEKAA